MDDNSKKYRESLELAEWIFNDYTDYYERYELDGTNQDQYESWLSAIFAPIGTRLNIVKIEKTAGAFERRYEVAHFFHPNHRPDIYIRIATHQLGGRVLIFARGPEWHYSGLRNHTGKNVVLRYYLEFENFCRLMLSDWHKPLPEDFIKEKEQYPKDHEMFKEMFTFEPRVKIDYSNVVDKNQTETEPKKKNQQDKKKAYDTKDIRKTKAGYIEAKRLIEEEGQSVGQAVRNAGINRTPYYYWQKIEKEGGKLS